MKPELKLGDIIFYHFNIPKNFNHLGILVNISERDECYYFAITTTQLLGKDFIDLNLSTPQCYYDEDVFFFPASNSQYCFEKDCIVLLRNRFKEIDFRLLKQANYKLLCNLPNNIFNQLINCYKNSSNVPTKILNELKKR